MPESLNKILFLSKVLSKTINLDHAEGWLSYTYTAQSHELIYF